MSDIKAGPDGVPDKSNPFIAEDSLSDLALVVEGKKLHVHKMIPATSSPVFKAMFFPEPSTEFKEKNATELPLPGKKYDDVLNFLLQLYARHCTAPITDNILEGVMALADEYHVDHLLDKCELFVETQLKSHLSADKKLMYLWLCEIYNKPKHRDALIKTAADETLEYLQQSTYFLRLPEPERNNLILKRCQKLESRFSEW